MSNKRYPDDFKIEAAKHVNLAAKYVKLSKLHNSSSIPSYDRALKFGAKVITLL